MSAGENDRIVPRHLNFLSLFGGVMKGKEKATYIKNVILPGFVVSGLTGVITGAAIFFFKWGAEFIGAASTHIYGLILENPAFVPLMFIALVGLALCMAFIIKGAPAVAGGGIPTAEGILRGLITFRWLRTFLSMIINSYIAFFAGLPLGNEGPSVLIGTSLGRGTNNLFNRNPAWDRYVMTGGAAAGFAVATGAPATGMIFALEEVHKRFSPMILMVAMSSVVFAAATSEVLGLLFGRSTAMFSLTAFVSVPVRYYWIGLVAGIVAALTAVAFIKGFTLMYRLLSEKIAAVPVWVKLVALFLVAGAVALALPAAAGSGHGVIESVLERGYVWYMLLVLLIVKIVMIILCGGAGATGGLFIPVLTVGALAGGLLAELVVFLGVPSEYYSIIVTVTISAFLGATLRAPITAIVFFIEALGGFNNILFSAAGVLIAFVFMELVGVKPLYEVVLERKLKVMHRDEKPHIVEFSVTVKDDSFVVGKTTRDIFWPPSCLVLQVVRAGQNAASDARMDKDGDKVLKSGDSLSLRVQTYDEPETRRLIGDLVGVQDDSQRREYMP